MNIDRRLPRSQRAVMAVSLLIISAAAVVAGIVASTVPALVATSVIALIAGILAARLMSNELAQHRRDSARDRASLADEARREAVQRATEHMTFADQMSGRVAERDDKVALLTGRLRTIEVELSDARYRIAQEQARCEALVADVHAGHAEIEAARAELLRARDDLAASRSAELAAKAEIVAWEQAASDSARVEHERRSA